MELRNLEGRKPKCIEVADSLCKRWRIRIVDPRKRTLQKENLCSFEDARSPAKNREFCTLAVQFDEVKRLAREERIECRCLAKNRRNGCIVSCLFLKE
jgi:hypothetical protein